MDRLARSLDGGLKRLRVPELGALRELVQRWPEVVGDGIAHRCRPRYVRRGLLVVEVSTAAWSHQLTLMKDDLLGAIARSVPALAIKDVRFQVLVPRDVGSQAPIVEGPDREALAQRAPLGEGERAAIARAVSGRVRDETLASGVHRMLEAMVRRQRALREAGFVPCPSCGLPMRAGRSSRQICPTCRATDGDPSRALRV
ncbi:MAG: DUF721 domain-containing protein [bacterium]|nr:DUF721 domain-containing protein [bacterium]